MIVIFEKNNLIKKLSIATSIISIKSPLPILSNLKMITSNDGKIKIYSTDLNMSISTAINAEILEEGIITLPAKKFFDIIREVEGNKIKIRTDSNNNVKIECETSKFNLIGNNAEDFPKIPEYEINSHILTFPKDLIKDAFRKTIFSVSYDESRQNVNGIFMKINNDELEIASTDGKRLRFMSNKVESTEKNIEIIIPTRTVLEVLKIISMYEEESNISIFIREKQVTFRIADNFIISKVIEGNFPDYKKAIPTEFKKEIIINKNKIISLTKRLSVVSNDSITAIKYYFEKNILKASLINNLGEGTDEMEITYDSDEQIEVSYIPNYILDILKNIDEEYIVIKIFNNLTPCMIIPKDNLNYKYLLMPVVLKN